MITEFLKYRKAKKRVSKLQSLDTQEILRDFILDTRLWEAQQVGTLLGLPEITKESVDAADERFKNVGHLMPLIAYLSATFAVGVMGYYDTVYADVEESSEHRMVVEGWVAKITTAATLGMISQFDALDLIEIKP